MDGNSTVHVTNLKSIPYVDMTMDILRDFGVVINHDNYETFHIQGVKNRNPKAHYTVR